MIPFFRKIRKQFADNNKPIKYMRYAIGEIVLIVIGILIALGINSHFQTAQNEKKIKSILVQLKAELSTDILDAHRICSTLITNDSLARRIYNDELTLEEFRSFPIGFKSKYVSFSNNKTSYNRLMQNIEIVPDKYAPLLPNLHLLYVEYQNDIDDFNTRIKDVVYSAGDKDYATDPWRTNWYIGKDTVSWAKHLYSDPYLKNKTDLYMSSLSDLAYSANNYRAVAITTYKKIDSLLNVNRTTYTRHLQEISTDVVFLKEYKGTYTFENGDEVDIYIENHQLYLKSKREVTKLWWHAEGDYYAMGALNLFRFTENEQGERTIELRWLGRANVGTKKTKIHENDQIKKNNERLFQIQ